MTICKYEVAGFQQTPVVTTAKKSAVVLFMPLLLNAGTGGALTIQNAKYLGGWFSTIHVEQPIRRKIDTRSPAELVAIIREALGLNMSELASVLGATRPTAYAWLDGQEPKPEALIHIQRLAKAADDALRIDIPHIDKLIRRPILNGQSLLDKLKTNEDPLQSLQLIKSIAEKEGITRRAQKGSSQNLRSFTDVASDYSIQYSNQG